MRKMIAYCGLDCEKCDAYIATVRDDQALREKTAKAWAELNHAPILPEHINCLGCPRNPIEIVDGVQTDCDGKNVDAPIRETVAQIMEQIRHEKIESAILQSRSPTCGVNQIYDGSFTGKLISGSGVFAQSLKDAGYRIIDAEDISNGAE